MNWVFAGLASEYDLMLIFTFGAAICSRSRDLRVLMG